MEEESMQMAPEDKEASAKEMLKLQIQRIKDEAKNLDESQGIVSGAMSHLIMVQLCQGIGQSLTILNQQLLDLQARVPKDQPLIVRP